MLLLALSIAALSRTTDGKSVKSLEPLFQAVIQYRSDSETDAVVAVEGREGAYIGSGDGIETTDGARIRFDGRGYGLRGPDKYRVSVTLVFGTEDASYAWLAKVPAVMEGEFDEKAGRASWNVHIPSASH